MKQNLHQNQDLLTRLSGYALIALTPDTNGQIVYSGLQNIRLNMPDSTFALYMDADNFPDFIFQIYGYSETYTNSDPLVYSRYANGFAAIINPRTNTYKNSWIFRNTYIQSTNSTSLGTNTNTLTYPIVDGLVTGVQVDASQSMWANTSSLNYSGFIGYGFLTSFWGAYSGVYSNGYGDFFGQEKYIGVSFYIGTDQHYGWIRVSLGDYIDPMTIIDWAYESTPGDSIITGAGDYEGPHASLEIGFTATENLTENVLLTFNERAYNFELAQLNITNGVASNLVEVIPGREYTFDITAINEGFTEVIVPESCVTDLSGNGNNLDNVSWIYSEPINLPANNMDGIRIYPNPAHNELFIDLSFEAAIEIYDLNGNKILTYSPSVEKKIDLSNFSKGIYIVQIKNNDRISRHKIIVE
jgi:hypothetical protein